MLQLHFRITFISIIAILAACSEKETLTIDKEIESLNDPSQFFEISRDKADTIVAKNETKIIVPANAFVLNDGQEPNAKIQIEVKEVFNKSEMILNNLQTVSDGRLIESYGMVYLKAVSDNQELKIKDDKSIVLIVPNKRKGSDGELFYGQKRDGTINWEYASANVDTVGSIVAQEEAMTETLSGDSLEGQPISDAGDATGPGYETAIGTVIPDYYTFKVEHLGWINCDRFIDIEDKIELELGLKNYHRPISFLVFAEINSVMRVFFDRNGKVKIGDLPDGYLVDIVVVDKINDELVWVKRSIKLGSDLNIILETKTIDKDQLKIELLKLDD